MKLPFIGKKSKGDDDSDEDDEESEEEGEEASSSGDKDGDGEDEDFDDDDDDEESGGGGKKRLIIIAAASVVGLAVIGGGAAWWFLGADDAEQPGAGPPAGSSAKSSVKSGVPVVSLAVPPKSGALGSGGMSPPSGGKAGAGTLNAFANETGPGAGIVVPSVTVAAYATLSPVAPDKPLSEVPDPELVEQSKQGPLPKVSADGRMSWQVYARPSDPAEARPRVAIIIGGLGMSRAATEAAINRLSGAVTLAFDPYAEGLGDWLVAARQAGHEVLMGLPMEPDDFPRRDPGPYALMTSLEAPQILQRLNFVLSRASGYVGLISVMGSRFSAEADHIQPLLLTLKNRGLMYIDNGAAAQLLVAKTASTMGVPSAFVDGFLDRDPSKAAIDAQLVEIEKKARRNSAAVVLGQPFPSTLDRIAAWIATLEAKKLALVPISAIADKQKPR